MDPVPEPNNIPPSVKVVFPGPPYSTPIAVAFQVPVVMSPLLFIRIASVKSEFEFELPGMTKKLNHLSYHFQFHHD